MRNKYNVGDTVLIKLQHDINVLQTVPDDIGLPVNDNFYNIYGIDHKYAPSDIIVGKIVGMSINNNDIMYNIVHGIGDIKTDLLVNQNDIVSVEASIIDADDYSDIPFGTKVVIYINPNHDSSITYHPFTYKTRFGEAIKITGNFAMEDGMIIPFDYITKYNMVVSLV